MKERSLSLEINVLHHVLVQVKWSSMLIDLFSANNVHLINTLKMTLRTASVIMDFRWTKILENVFKCQYKILQQSLMLDKIKEIPLEVTKYLSLKFFREIVLKWLIFNKVIKIYLWLFKPSPKSTEPQTAMNPVS